MQIQMRHLAFALFFACTVAMERNKIYMRKAEMQDQAASATGYVYSQDSAGPASYAQYSDTSGSLESFGYPPVTLGHFENDGSLYPMVYAESYPGTGHEDGGYGAGAKNYENGGGSSYEDTQHSTKGEKGHKGYNNIQTFEKGANGKHAKDEHKGYYNKKDGNTEGDLEESGNYGTNDEAAESFAARSAGKSSGSKKGSKTTGYRKLYHKDEYKKDHSFYDEADKSGHFNKYGDYDSHHSAKSGSHRAGGKADAANKEAHHAQEGHRDKGHHLENDEGYKGEEGASKHYRDYSDYAKRSAQDNAGSHGYSEGDNPRKY